MKKLNPMLLLAAFIALCTNAALAQGTMFATWHNQNGPIQGNLFQASFQIYDSEMAPGADFSVTRLFDQTLTVASPDHVFPALGVGALIEQTPTGGGCGFTGPGGSLYLSAGLRDFANTSYWVGVGDSDIFEAVNGITTYRERGYWTFTSIPEPSSCIQFLLGLLVLVVKKRPSRGGRCAAAGQPLCQSAARGYGGEAGGLDLAGCAIVAT